MGLFFFTILGIVAIVFASQVEDRWRRGDAPGAWSASRAARGFGIAAIVLGIVTIGVIVGIAVATRDIYTYTPTYTPRPVPSVGFPTFPPLSTP